MRFFGNEQRTGDDGQRTGDGQRTDDNGRRTDDVDSESPLERVEPASIVVEDVSLSFGDLSVLGDISLTVDPGEFVGFVGPNGAGKTTLLRAISGALEPGSGRVTVDDVDIHDASSKRSSRLVSVVPQDTTLSFSFPVRDVVEMGRHPHRSRFSSPTAEDREAVERALERTRTADLADRPIDEVSGGQRQRVVLARAIAQATPVMLLDEPTASLDVNHQIETLELVRELVAEGRTVCAAIHDLELAARYCDRLVMLADGEVYRNGPPGDVLTGESLSAVFDATAAVTRNPITGTETVTAFPNDAVEDRNEEDGSDRRVRVHVLGTGRTAAGVVARLATAGAAFDVSVGPVASGDTAAETARSLAVDRLEVEPFESLSAADLTAFEDRVRDADATVVTEGMLDAGGAGTRRLLESVEAVADTVVIATGAGDDPSRAETTSSPERERERVATPETIREAIRSALENGRESARSIADFGSSDAGSSSSDGDSSSGVSAESSND